MTDEQITKLLFKAYEIENNEQINQHYRLILSLYLKYLEGLHEQENKMSEYAIEMLSECYVKLINNIVICILFNHAKESNNLLNPIKKHYVH